MMWTFTAAEIEVDPERISVAVGCIWAGCMAPVAC